MLRVCWKDIKFYDQETTVKIIIRVLLKAKKDILVIFLNLQVVSLSVKLTIKLAKIVRLTQIKLIEVKGGSMPRQA
jgi:hypothetical protein